MKTIFSSKKNVVSILFIFLFFQCSNIVDGNDKKKKFKVDNFNINILEEDELPYVWKEIGAIDNYPMDSSGVMIFIHNNNTYYHPVALAQKMFRFIDNYNKTSKQIYLDRAVLFASKLREISVEFNSALYFPYPFDWDLHAISGETMTAPWYSGMAQGQILTAFVRLYNITEDTSYLNLANKVYKSFENVYADFNPWTVFIDENGYYWIEEYPTELGRTRALNGFIYALYGLYDYYLLTKDEGCREYLLASITTVKHYIEEYRNPGDISYYCLRHKLKYPNYHKYHTEQLSMLYKITGDSYFLKMFNLFYNDYH